MLSSDKKTSRPARGTRRDRRFVSIAEARTIDYIVRELGLGRELFSILEDPYVRNRIPLERRHALQEDEELLAAFMAEITAVRARIESSAAPDEEG